MQLAASDTQRINHPTSSGGWCAAVGITYTEDKSSEKWCPAGNIIHTEDKSFNKFGWVLYGWRH